MNPTSASRGSAAAKCCTEVCPEHIKITDNAIIPLKERLVDAHYDPVMRVIRKLRGKE